MTYQREGTQNAIIIAEDDVLVRMVTADILTDAGYRVLEAGNAEEALRLLDVRPNVRVLLTDVNMPGNLDGYALARIVDMRWPGVGVIVISGRMQPRPGDLPARSRFHQKPVSASDLLEAVARLMPSAPITIPFTEAVAAVPVLPSAIKIGAPHADVGVTGSLAQPLPDPE